MWAFSLTARAQLTITDVQLIINQASTRAVALGATTTVIAVTTREGEVLGVWSVNGAPPSSVVIGTAVSKAGTASFLSSNQNAFTTRTAAYITQQNFPPGIINRPQGALVGIGLSSLSQSDANHFRAPPFPADFSIGNPVLNSSLTISPGGLPLYKNGILVGGIGVAGVQTELSTYVSGYFESEDIALAGQSGYAPGANILATGVFLDGIRLPYVESSTSLGTVTATGAAAPGYPVQGAPPATPWPQVTLGGVPGQYRRRDWADPDPVDPSPIADPAGTTTNVPAADRLTRAEVIQILTQGAQRAVITRSAIRQPLSSPSALYVEVVNNPDQTTGSSTNPSVTPRILGVFRMNDSINDAFDVTPQKARSALFFSNSSFAFDSRSIGFLAQSYFPPGINGTSPGPFNAPTNYQAAYSAPASTTPPNYFLRDGLTLFGGAVPLYRNTGNGFVLIGAVGASGDGVDQDDLVAAAASVGFEAPSSIRADQFSYNNARLPFVKFPRQPVR